MTVKFKSQITATVCLSICQSVCQGLVLLKLGFKRENLLPLYSKCWEYWLLRKLLGVMKQGRDRIGFIFLTETFSTRGPGVDKESSEEPGQTELYPVECLLSLSLFSLFQNQTTVLNSNMAVRVDDQS